MKKIVARLLGVAALFAPAAAMAQASPSDFTSATRYDIADRVTGTIAPDPDGTGPLRHLAVRNSYDAAGRLVKVEKGQLSDWMPETVEPKDWTGFSIHQTAEIAYDVMGRKIREQVREGAAGAIHQLTQYSYDALGRLECTTVRMNPAAFGSLPGSACTLGTEGSQGADRITKNVYDAAGQLAQVRKAVGTNLEQAYATYGYTDNGKQEYVVDANGNKARLVYDGHDRQAQWQFPSTSAPGGYNPSTPANALATSGAANTNDREEYGYDANSNRTSLRKRDGRVFTYAFDNLNRMTSKIVPTACVSGYACTNVPASMARSVYYAYDLRGLQTAAQFDSASGADAVTQAYDGFGRISSSTTSMGGVSRTLSYQYDANGNRTQVMYPDGNYAGYHYDGLNRLYTAGVNTTSGLLIRYYDSAGQLAQNLSGSWTYYAYDGVGRLTGQNEALTGSGAGSVNTVLGYNPASQITSRSRNNDTYGFTGYANANRAYTVNGLNQYGSAGGVSFGYDSNGNLTASGSTAYTYDAENRLVVASSGVQLTWDPLGRLYETYSPGTGVTRFLYSGDELVAEYDGAGTMLRRYIHGPGTDDPLAWFEGPVLGGSWSNARLPKTDHQGSVVAWTDWNGALSQVNRYDEYGIPAATNIGRFQYTGQAWIPELGMYHYKARIYSPTLGRFLQTDPIGYQDQVNLYAYVGNDPMDGRDPTGNFAEGFSLTGKGCPAGSICVFYGSLNAAADPGGAGKKGRGGRPGNGEAGRTAGASGTDNPDKKYRPGPNPGTRQWKDPNGKTHVGPWPQDGRKGGDGTGVHPNSKYPDGTPVSGKGAPTPTPTPSPEGSSPSNVPAVNRSSSLSGPVAILGIGVVAACVLLEPCGAVLGTITVAGAAVAVVQ